MEVDLKGYFLMRIQFEFEAWCTVLICKFFYFQNYSGFRESRTQYWLWTRAILKVKKFTVLKWCIGDKFCLQKLGVTKGFFKVKVLSDFDFGDFWKNWLQRHQVAKQLQKIFDLWSTQKYSKESKICLACLSIFLEFLTFSSQLCLWRLLSDDTTKNNKNTKHFYKTAAPQG